MGAMQHLLPPLFAATALASCAVAAPQIAEAPPPPVFAAEECDAQAAQFAVGQDYTPALGEQVRARAHAERLRALRPGDMVTMEFNARRLSLDIDAQGKIVAARCG